MNSTCRPLNLQLKNKGEVPNGPRQWTYEGTLHLHVPIFFTVRDNVEPVVQVHSNRLEYEVDGALKADGARQRLRKCCGCIIA